MALSNEEDRPMTVGDLRKLLRRLPADMPIVECRFSDCCSMDADVWQKRKVVYKPGAQWHRLLDEGKDHPDAINVLYYRGN